MTTNDKMQQAKGRAEQAMGDIADDEQMREQGQADEAKGKTSEKIADIREKADEKVDELRNKIKK